MLHDYVKKNFTANRMVIAGSGMEHQELLSLVEPLASGVPSANFDGQPSSEYVGGDFRYSPAPRSGEFPRSRAVTAFMTMLRPQSS